MIQLFILTIIVMIGLVNISKAQEIEEEEEWVPSMLQARTNVYMQLMQYGGYGIGWKYRGWNEPAVQVINGIVWDSKSLGFPLYTAMSGLNNLSKTETMQTIPTIIQYANINASKQSRQISMLSRYQPLSGRQNNQLVWTSGLQKQSWATLLKIQEEKTFMQDPALGRKNLVGIAFSAEKLLANNTNLSIAFWYDHLHQTKQSPTVLEAIKLSGNKLYNPGWGWKDGQILFPNARASSLPMAQMAFSKKIKEHHFVQLSWAMAFGKQSEDGLDWTSTKDPRPDYYKYLPSYYKDSMLQQKIIKVFEENPLALQLDFDQMKKINQSNKEGRSFYAISRAHDAIRLLQQSIQYKYNKNGRGQFAIDYNAAIAKIEKSNTIANLLGGKYYLNYNSWVNDDGVDVFQYNLKKPDQQIIEGSLWGPHYAVKNIDHRLGLVVTAQYARWEYRLGIGYGVRFFQRDGFNQNGLYPEHSLGKSVWYVFPSNNLQWEMVYKRNARLYFTLNAFRQQVAPSWKEAFLNSAMQDRLSNFLLPVQEIGMDLAVHYLGIYYRTDWHLYSYWQRNKMDKTSFYHDYYNAFVQGSYGLSQTQSAGIEGSAETSFNAMINYQLAFSWGKHIFLNNPIYTIQLLNNDYPLESGNLHLENLPASTSPKIIIAAGMNAQLSSTLRLGFTAQIGWDRFLALDYYRRSFLWERKFKEQYPSNQLLPVYPLPNGLIGNLFCNKNFQFKSARLQHRFRLNVQVNNIFNTIIPVLAFEQARFDYKNFQPDKFAPKFILERPLNGSIQFIYQIN